MNCALAGKNPKGRSNVATYLLAAMILLAVASASGQQVHQLLYNNSNWADQNLMGAIPEVGTPVAAFPTTPNDQSHVYYLAGSPVHVHQLFYNGTSWSDEDLTSLSGGPAASYNVTGFSVGNLQYVYYVSHDSDVHQLLYNNSSWVDSDITILGGLSANAISTYGLVAFTTSPALHVYYQDNVSADVHQLFSTNGTTWQDQDLTQLTGAGEPAVLWSGFNIGNLQYLYYQDFDHDIHQLNYNNSKWVDTDLTLTSKPLALPIYQETAFVIPGTKKIRLYYTSKETNGHLVQLASSNGKTWTSTDLTNKAKAPVPQSNSSISAYATTPNDGVHIFYEAGNHIIQIYQPTPTTWASVDLTTLTNGGTAVNLSRLAGFSLQNFQYLFYVAQ
jgi:Fungal fucose-specific lectin